MSINRTTLEALTDIVGDCAVPMDGEVIHQLGPFSNLDVSIPIGDMERFVATVRKTLADNWPNTGSAGSSENSSNIHYLMPKSS